MPLELGAAAPILALVLLLGVFAVFILEIRPPEIVAFCGAAVALALGLVETEDVLAAIANPAPATIGAMFVLSAALVRTGALEVATLQLRSYAARRPGRALIAFFAAAAAASAVMNNTPVVMVLIPVVMGLAREIGAPPSRLLMPLSFMVILGGTCSLIGTSTNLLVDGIARDMGLAPFSLFEIAPLGLAVALLGGGFLALTGRWLLPDRAPPIGGALEREPRAWLAELFIPTGSPLIGRPALDVPELRRGGRLVDIVRSDVSLRRELATVRLEAGDVAVIRTRDVDLMGFREGAARRSATVGLEPAQARRSVVVEALVGPNARVLGRTLEKLRWRRAYGVYPIALHREGGSMSGRLDQARLAVGDTLLLDGAPEDLGRLLEETRLTSLSPTEARPFRREKAPIAVGALAAVVILSAFDVAPILTLSLLAVAAVLATRCVDADEGLGAMDGRLLLLVVSMLTLGSALDRSGGLDLVMAPLSPWLEGVSPLLTLALIYAGTSILTELITNNAVAVLMTPVAAGAAASLGLDPRPFVVAVMFGASASFATPIGYQTNTLVYNAGGYRFADFLRAGLPMNLIVGAATVLLIPLFWPLEAG